MAKLPARSNFRTRTRRGASKTPDVRNVPRVRTSSDPGVSVPRKGVFGEYEAESLAETGQSMMGLSDTLFKVQNKLKKREDDRFLIEYEEGISKDFSGLVQKWDEAGDLGNPKHLESLQKEIENINANYEEPSANLNENGLIKFNAIKRQYNLSVATEIAKIYEAKRNAKNLQKINNLSTTIANDPHANEAASISENFATFTDAFYDKYASQISENQEEGVIRDNLKNITRIQVDNLFRTNNDSDYDTIEQILSDPSVRELTVKPDGSRDKDFYGEVNSYWERLNRTKQDKTDLQKRMGQVSELMQRKVLPQNWNSPEVQSFLIENKLPEKTPEAKKLEAYQAALKNAPKGEDGIILPTAKAVIDDAFDMGKPEGYELKRANFLKWKEDNPNASTEEIAVAESTFMGLPMSPEVEARLKAKGAIALAAAASGATTQAIQAMGLEVPKDNLEKVKQAEEEIKFLKSKGIEISKEQEKRFYMEKAGLKEKELSPIEQVYKDANDLRDNGVFISIEETNLLAKQKAGFKLSELEQKQAIEIEARINSFKTVQEAKGIAEGVEEITDPKVKDLVEQKLGLDVPPEKQNKVEKLLSRINTGKKAGVILSDADKELLIKKEIGDIPLNEEEQIKAKELEGRLSAIKKDAEIRKARELETPQEPKELNASKQKLIATSARQTVAGVGENFDQLTPSQTKAANKLAAKITEYVKAGDDINTANLKASIDMNDEFPKPPAEEAIDNILKEIESEPVSDEELDSAEDIYKNTVSKIDLSDATGLPAQAVNALDKLWGIVDEGGVDRAVVRGRQMLLLLGNDLVIALAKNPKVPVHEQKRLLNMIPEPSVFNNVPQVQEQLKLFKREILADIKRQKKLVKPGIPEKEREKAFAKIIALTPIVTRLNQFKFNEIPKFKNVDSINKASKDDLILFRDANKKADWIKWGKKNPNLYKAFIKKWDAMNDSAKGE